MNDLLSQYEWTIVEMISGILSIGFIVAVCMNANIIESQSFQSLQQSVKGAQVTYEIPVVDEGDFIVDNAIIKQNSYFNWRDYVHVSTNQNENIIDYVSVTGNVDTSTQGEYPLTFTLHYNGKTIVKKATYYVMGEI